MESLQLENTGQKWRMPTAVVFKSWTIDPTTATGNTDHHYENVKITQSIELGNRACSRETFQDNQLTQAREREKERTSLHSTQGLCKCLRFNSGTSPSFSQSQPA